MRQSDSPSSGPGGQKINKTSSAVQLIHAPTGVVVKCQETRSRSQNRVIARNLLANKLEVLDKGPLSRQGQLIAKKVAQKKSATKKSRRKHAKGGVEGSYNNPDEGEFLDDNGVWVSGVVTEADLKGAVELKGLSKMKIISPKATSNKPWDFERPGIFTTRVHRGVPEGVGIEACGGEEGALVMYRGHSGAEMDETGEFIEGIDEDEYDDEGNITRYARAPRDYEEWEEDPRSGALVTGGHTVSQKKPTRPTRGYAPVPNSSGAWVKLPKRDRPTWAK